MKENVPGSFPTSRGRVRVQAEGEDPTRMFAVEGDAFPDQPAVQAGRRKACRRHRLFPRRVDSVTLYGSDPDPGRTFTARWGNSGVSIATPRGHEGAVFGLRPGVRPSTSVSMTINGPARSCWPMFMNTAIDQQVDKFRDQERTRSHGRRAAEDQGVDAVDRAGPRFRPTS